MQKAIKINLPFLFIFLIISNVFSNGAPILVPFDQKPAVVIPIKNNNISMKNETIIITVNDQNENIQIQYDCTFTFKNHTNEKQKVTIGFPIDYYWLSPQNRPINDEIWDSEEDQLESYKATAINKIAKDLKIFINNIETNFKRYKFGSNKELGIDSHDTVFAFDTYFDSNETLVVRIVFTEEKTEYGIYLEDDYNYHSLKYILKTAHAWKNPIEFSQIQIHFVGKKGYIPEIRKIPEPYYDNFQVKGNSLIFTFHDFYPPEDLEVKFIFFKDEYIYGSSKEQFNTPFNYNSLDYLNFSLIMEYFMQHNPDSKIIKEYEKYYNKSGQHRVVSILASSYIDWKNTYIPKVIFDGNPKTGWLEAADGPGVGEKIYLKLENDITIDEIKIMPGYFDPKWWAANNRVKSLTIDYGENSFDITFKDEMQIQNIILPKPTRFRDITFTIKEVYASKKDNDTGISEIEFWYTGNKIKLDISGVN